MSYSPFFTSGLLLAHNDDSLNFMFKRENILEYRSFLSLDLAESTKQSQRTFPSRKPAPLSALPLLPGSFDLPPRIPTITFSAPISFSSLHKQSHSAPSVSSHRTPLRPISISTCASSRSATTQQRTFSRSDALACLEGRSKSRKRIPRIRFQHNFMSMSDDEDELDDPDSPSISTPSPVSITLLSDEKEDVVIPSCFDFSDTPSPHLMRRHKTPTESWFPLASFMDVRDDDLSTWHWRSFIEVASVS